MKGYWGDKEKSEECMTADGWMKTGDVGIINDKGYLKIDGRIKDMIIRGGENISPKEIEEFFLQHPDIFDCQVVSVPDQRMGEEVCMFIKPAEGKACPTKDQIKTYSKGQIAHYKIPTYVLDIQEFPLTVTGKVQKIKLRDIAKE